VGQTLGGRYKIQDALTPGAQGEVYRVRDEHLTLVCVLKLIDRAVIPGGDWDEAQILNHLADDHILPILNADLLVGQPYIVTALAENGTLKTALDATGGLGLPSEKVVDWIRESCMGVARAHDASLAHNDIKPANLFLNAKGECLVGDFGFASKLLPPPLVSVAFGATPQTAAPEVLAGIAAGAQPASVESDVYSLGATAFWLLAGQPPIRVKGHGNARFAVAATLTPPRLRDVAPHVPASIASVIEKAMSRDPDDRYHSANDLSAALGSRSVPPRRWVRTDEHTGHTGCWRGAEKGRAEYVVCLELDGKPTKCNVVGRYRTGAKIHGASRSCNSAKWAQAVRATIDKLS
jgi:serine/threonine-protein kinase